MHGPATFGMCGMYCMYSNADLLEVTKNGLDMMSLGFIDDIVYGIEGKPDRHNVCKLSLAIFPSCYCIQNSLSGVNIHRHLQHF